MAIIIGNQERWFKKGQLEEYRQVFKKKQYAKLQIKDVKVQVKDILGTPYNFKEEKSSQKVFGSFAKGH